MLKFTSKRIHTLLKTVVNIDNNEMLPFLEPSYTRKINKLSKANLMSIVYPKDIDQFLLHQSKEKAFGPSYSEVYRIY